MRWAYLSRGRTRLIGHNFPKRKIGPDWRSFLDAWYTTYDWLEYSVEKDAAYREIQLDITRACAEETTQVIMSELGNASFSLLVDESRDVSVKEQMAVILRLVIRLFIVILYVIC